MTEVKRQAFFKVKVFPNIWLLGFKAENGSALVLTNPGSAIVEELIQTYSLIGFSCREYDNHILYEAVRNDAPGHLYSISSRVQSSGKYKGDKEAYGISYLDMANLLTERKSFARMKIKAGCADKRNYHDTDHELKLNELEEEIQYLISDVEAMEKIFQLPDTQQDYRVRKILVDLAECRVPGSSSVNDTTNHLTERIIFGSHKNTAEDLIYTDLHTGISTDGRYHESNHFPFYRYTAQGESFYEQERLSEGGYTWAEPGAYQNVVLYDIRSMNPHTILALNMFGRYTKNFKALVDARLALKQASHAPDPEPYLKQAEDILGMDLCTVSDMDLAKLDHIADALKLAVNSVYGLTAAKYDNPFRDSRNKDNIAAKRGSLFMVQLKNEALRRGYKVIHIKTDSIKIADYTSRNRDEIDNFIFTYGKGYGYTFEKEAVFSQLCLLNKVDYVCKVKEGSEKGAGPSEWSGTGTVFKKSKNPYMFKKLFSQEEVSFRDTQLTITNGEGLYLDEISDELLEAERLLKIETPDSYEKKKLSAYRKKHGDLSDTELEAMIKKAHKLHDVSTSGIFIPVKTGGQVLYQMADGRLQAVPRTEGYRWKQLDARQAADESLMEQVDVRFFTNQILYTKSRINHFTDFQSFTEGKTGAPADTLKGKAELMPPGFQKISLRKGKLAVKLNSEQTETLDRNDYPYEKARQDAFIRVKIPSEMKTITVVCGETGKQELPVSCLQVLETEKVQYVDMEAHMNLYIFGRKAVYSCVFQSLIVHVEKAVSEKLCSYCNTPDLRKQK